MGASSLSPRALVVVVWIAALAAAGVVWVRARDIVFWQLTRRSATGGITREALNAMERGVRLWAAVPLLVALAVTAWWAWRRA